MTAVADAVDVLAAWTKGRMTYVHARRSLIALGYRPDEADAALAAAKLESGR